MGWQMPHRIMRDRMLISVQDKCVNLPVTYGER